MKRILTIAIAIAAIGGAACAYAPEGAMATTSTATLSSTEYAQLSKAYAGAKKFKTWKQARSACRAGGSSTPLVKAVRTSCLGQITTLEAITAFVVQDVKCNTTTGTTTTGTTTTGTTTTGTTTTETTPANPLSSPTFQLLACLSPGYQQLSQATKAMYPEDIAAFRAAKARGFTGICLVTLAETSKQLAAEKELAPAVKHLAADTALLAKVESGNAPAGEVNAGKVQRDLYAFDDAFSAYSKAKGYDKLSVCPHQ